MSEPFEPFEPFEPLPSDATPSPDLTDIMGMNITAMLEAAQARIDAEKAWTREHCLPAASIAGRGPGCQPARLNLLSLPSWLAVARNAGAPFIPARPLEELGMDAYKDVFDHTGTGGAVVDAWMDRVIAQLGTDEILRFEQCTHDAFKADHSVGTPGKGLFVQDNGRVVFDIWTERFYESLRALGADRVRPFARPYVAPAMVAARYEQHGTVHDGVWPVEFRVFVDGGKVAGVSAYYPQAPLDDSWLPAARAAADLARRIVAWMDQARLGVGNGEGCADLGPADGEDRPAWMPASWGPQRFTLDVLWPADGSGPVLLEGGPGEGWRTAPCCFEGRDRIAGIALATNGPIHPLEG